MRLCCSILLFLGLTSIAIAKESTDRPHAGSNQPPMTPAESQKKFAVPKGFEVRLFAAEPDVVNPVAMTFDEKGRLWVVELYEYPNGAKPGTKGRDRVKCYWDTDDDGVADKSVVFCDGLSLATAVLVGNGGVYVGQAPHLYFYPIASDGPEGPKAGERKIVLTGFGLHDRHELLNSFAWGPDGWLYMTHGVFTHSVVKDPNNPNDDGIKMDATVARYNTRTGKFELFSDGISNQWGVDWDRAGNAFVSACVVEHIWHIAPGGVYIRQGGQPTIPYTYELLKPINKDRHRHHMAAYGGIAVYQGNLFPEEYRGTVFMGNIHGNCIDHDKLTPDGASFSASDLRKKTDTGEFLEANDDWFRPVNEQVGPDGALWIMDWYDRYPCYQNAQAPDLDRTRGRIWRVVYVGDEKGKKVAVNPSGDLGAMSDVQLVEMLSHANVWQRRQAQRLLSERKTKAASPLAELLKAGKTLEARLAALWSLHGAGGLTEETLDSLADDKEPSVRGWAARLTGERGEANSPQVKRLTKLAADTDAVVRSFVAHAARRLGGATTVPVVTTLLKQPGTEKDPIMPFMIWMAAEGSIAREPKLLLEVVKPGPEIPPAAMAFTRKAMRRVADTHDPAKMDQAMAMLETLSATPALASAAIDGLLDMKQHTLPATDPEPALTKFQHSADKELADRATRLAAGWGNAKAATALLRVLVDPKAEDAQRLRAARAARDFKTDESRSALLAALDSKPADLLKLEIIRSLSELGSDEAATRIVREWKQLSPEMKRSVAEIMAMRVPWAIKLLEGYEAKVVSPADIPLTAVRNISRQKDKRLVALLNKTIGPFRESPAEKVKLIAAKKQVVLNGPVDLAAGKELAAKTCLVCHTFHNDGGMVGPDLTGSGRSSLDALLANVIDPNQIIGKGYENTIVETKDDRLVTGRLVEETDSHVKLLAQGPKEEVIARKDIKKIRTEEISVMPEGLENMPDADFRNLIWYVLSPPQDRGSRKILVERSAKELVIKARRPGEEDHNALLKSALDPAKLPAIDGIVPTDAAVALTLGSSATGRFVSLLDLNEAADNASWRAKVEWKLGDGAIVDDEQTITVHSPQSEFYYIDIERSLSPRGDKPVMVKAGESGGLVVQFKTEPRDLTVLSGAADWNGDFEGQTWGMSILEHPSSMAYPSEWLADDKTFAAAPFLKNEAKLEPGKPATFLYRLVIHKSKWTKERISQEQAQFSAERAVQ